jgi:hypothetical protein
MRGEQGASERAPAGGIEKPWWTMAEATLIRATAMLHVVVMASVLLLPAWSLARWGLPYGEPGTFMRAWAVGYGALGVGLYRALSVGRPEGRLLVEATALVKLGFAMVVLLDVSARRLPTASALACVLDMLFGFALLRMSRRRAV